MAVVTLPKNMQKVQHFDIGYYYDDTGILDINKLSSKTFTQNSSQFTFGFKTGNLWFKIDAKNSSLNEEFVLYLSEPYFSEVVLYEKEDDTWREDLNGLNIALKDRSLSNHNPAFNIVIPKDANKVFYVKINSKLTTSGEFEIYTKKHFNSLSGHYPDLLYMLYFGAILIISVINLFLYFKLRESIYIYYSGYTFFYVLWVASYSGLILYTPVASHFHKFIMVTPLFIMFLILFSSQFLNVKENLPKAYLPLNIFALSFGLLSVLIVISFDPWFEVMNSLASVLFLVLFSTAISIFKKTKDANVKYYLIIMTIYMITVSLMSAMANGWIQNNDINRYSFLYGSFFEILFFTLILTNRFYIFQKERLDMQQELIDIKNNEEVMLKAQIEDKTQDIKNLLNEKELLLKELYHRVKNNFHMIIGLLWIEEDSVQDKIIKNSYLKIISRINSMSIVHKYLYESDTFAHIDSKEYISEIISEVKNIYSGEVIVINKDIESFFIDINSAVELSMIINELLNNSIKHKREDEDCVIDISLMKKDTRITFIAQDNGLGFDIDKKNNGLGLKLIKQFSQKLPQAYYSFSFEYGTKFELSFVTQE
ncbi:7TM diverse intracellular signaling domain-containing protein [Sulfurimonas sp.]|uniref:7TM diverse intracellular signaling domain-containing protein n=1 Tax=Sulfurimonas sp. TaxID=2022749 RepID=UPI0025DFE09E|nr:7TM diverse intracellular signaling domain-containing protein [Sulfurimonas sp.]